jgi:ribulose-5-phosphate 4-epimerase/fuculose-1-phosphate aldolase
MSASGVDKSNLQEVGRDFLMVKDYDPERKAMVISVPPDIEPRRVSVDAIEHWMIYRDHPDVGAILHVHAWMDGIPSTEFNYPCGTYELGQAVADIVRSHPGPLQGGGGAEEPRAHDHRPLAGRDLRADRGPAPDRRPDVLSLRDPFRGAE